jgi:predicted deacylase
MVRNGLGELIRMPVIVARGSQPGPVIGVTAAVHGNELNGIRIIHRLLESLEMDALCGTVVAVPVVNIPGYLMNRREFNDGTDLNRLMPGREPGTSVEIYVHRFVDRIARHFNYLIDLHTASFGRVNSLYVRADLTNPITARLARLQHPQIIVHNKGTDGTLRSAAAALGIHAITVEIGDPQRFQRRLIQSSLTGILNVLGQLSMIDTPVHLPENEPVICGRSHWMYTDRGGVLEVFPEVTSMIETGQRVARVSNVYGDVVREYDAPESGIVVGKSSNPVNQAGSRILHLGIVGPPPQ